MPKPLLVLVKIKLSRFGLYQIGNRSVLLLGIHNVYRLPLVLTAKLLPAAVVTIPSSWEVSTGKLLQTLTGHTEPVRAIFSPDKKTLVSSGWDDVIKIWELPSGKLLRTLRGIQMGFILLYPDGQTLATGSGTKRFLEFAHWGANPHSQGSTEVFGVAVSLDGQTLASGGQGKVVQLWDLQTGKLRTFSGYTKPTWPITFSPDGKNACHWQ